MPTACGWACGQIPEQARAGRVGAGLQRIAYFLGNARQAQDRRARGGIVRPLLPFPPVSASAAALLCLVMSISDGDTLTARCGASRPERVRIAAIDAPESRQAFGQRARQNLARLCFRQQARLTRLGHDHYGRTLAQVRCQGQDVAAAQVRAGLAWVYAPQARQYPKLVALQWQARASRTGLWSQKRPLAPWDYRHQYPRQHP